MSDQFKIAIPTTLSVRPNYDGFDESILQLIKLFN